MTKAREARKVRGVYEKVPGSGVWWVRHADATGRIRRELAGAKSAAVALYQKRKTEALEGKKLPERLRARKVTFGEIAQDALGYSQRTKWSYRQDVYRMKKLLGWLGNKAADSITPQDIEGWLTTKAEEYGWKPATQNRFKSLLSLTFRLAVENGKITSNPARLVRRRREDNTRIRFLSGEEEQRLRSQLSNDFPEHLPAFEIALNTGMRSSEQYQLTWDCVDFERSVLTVVRSKNGEMRHIPINSAAMAAFELLFARSSGSGRVFLGQPTGAPLRQPRYWFERAVQQAGVESFTWHCLRHTFASRLVMAGVDLRTVQQLLGHKTIQMTVRYAHLAPEHQLAAVEKLCQGRRGPVGATDTKTGTDASPANVTISGAIQ